MGREGVRVARWQGFYDELASTRYSALLSYAIAFTGQRTTAEDLVQEAMVRTFASPRRLNSAQHAEHYVRRSIASIFIDDARRGTLFHRASPVLALAETEPDRTVDVGDRDAVSTALAALAPQVRACMVLRYYDDLTVPQVAERLGLAQGSVKRYLHDGAEVLRASLGADPDDERIGVLVTPRKEH